MNINEFNQQFYKSLDGAVQSMGGRIDKVSVSKNNQVLQGIAIRFTGSSLGVTIYPQMYFEDYKNGIPMSDIISGIQTEILRTKPPEVNISNFSKEKATTHLRASIVNYENNKAWLKDIPHERLADLAVFAKWDFRNNYAAKVNNFLLGQMGLTKEEALKIAKSNTGRSAELKSMNEVMEGIIKEAVDDDGLAADLAAGLEDSPLYVLTTESGFDGASLIADKKVMRQVHEELGEDFYILPSSIHEVILVGKSDVDGDVDSLREMVQSVNEREVPIEDRLSDQVYEFNGNSLILAGMDELKEEHNIADMFHHHHKSR